ncbi:MAG: hypothetical protein V9E93_12690 [Steroidobacteraceae bacterium]|nr:hypothetical protein [Pseudomonadota bacterium]MBP6107311.1 hypothetical protein [Steroidobacteraceae bacterium]MBP7014545.1 hypothetical protein [Steroidobacteraceae bacterium]
MRRAPPDQRKNHTGKRDTHLFTSESGSDGLPEELLNLLAQVPLLRVIARTSSFSFKGRQADIADIAQKLNVAHVLEGGVRKSGDTLRITAQLIRAADSSHLWSQSYDRPMTDVFKVQDEIAAAVVDQLKIQLLGAAPNAKATDPKAYALFLQAREIGRHHTAAAFEQSIALFQQALALDPAYAAAWVGLAEWRRLATWLDAQAPLTIPATRTNPACTPKPKKSLPPTRPRTRCS